MTSGALNAMKGLYVRHTDATPGLVDGLHPVGGAYTSFAFVDTFSKLTRDSEIC
jgi:hypothetical protein